MKKIDYTDERSKYSFLDDQSASEPYIFDVLNVISTYQTQSLPSGTRPLATLEALKKSRNIKIPFTTTRDKTIEYLVEILLKRFPHIVRPIVVFNFNIDDSMKKLNIAENTEYTIRLNDEEYRQLLAVKDKESINNLFELIKRYRFFNLSKLMKRANNKSELTRIVKLELGKKIFTYKNYSIDKNKIEWAEDFCFHAENYDAVKDSLNLNKLKEIIAAYSEHMKSGLRKFGILNSDFGDYRDTKLTYLFNILINDLATTLSDKDMVEVKNIQSLVTCLNKVDKVLDPILVVGDDILSFIKEQKICKKDEIIGSIPEITDDILKNWATDSNLKTNKIFYYTHENEPPYYIDGNQFFKLISEYNQLIFYQNEKMDSMSPEERRTINNRMDILYRASVKLLSSDEKIDDFISISHDDIQTLKKIVEEYESHINKPLIKEDVNAGLSKPKEKKSFLKSIANFIKSIFRSRKEKKGGVSGTASVAGKKLSKEANRVYRKAIDKHALVIPLSDLIDLSTDNNTVIDLIIQELRDHNLKLVVPIYNSRETLYPKRSQKLLLSDVEYLLVSPNVIRSPEAIRKFTDSLVGYKIKEDIIPPKAILTIEKYLLTLYRQKRALLAKRHL